MTNVKVQIPNSKLSSLAFDIYVLKGGGKMGKLEGVIKSEIVRLAKRETRRVSLPLSKDVRTLKSLVSQLRKSVSTLEKLAAQQQSELRKGRFRWRSH
jgi:hypothetical protein